ncbi:MAG TPA: hypothetical protein VFT51_14205 [Bacillales bacterium]|nr:hypothetical protein [Bacillales bacterium]
MGTIIKEVAFLDLTQASEEALKEIKAIHEVAFLVYNEKFEPYMPKVSFSEIASSVKVEGKCSFINGKLEFDKSFASELKDPLFFVVNGKFIVQSDVTAETIDQAIDGLHVNGKIYCPKHLQGVLQQKISQNNGQMAAYMSDAVLETNNLTVDNIYLQQLEPQTNLAFAGKVKMIENLDPSLVEEKLNKVEFLQEVVVSESNKNVINPKLSNPSAKITVVPEGFTYIDEDFHLDTDTLARYQQAKWFVTGSVHVDKAVTAEKIKNHIAEIRTDEAIYCRSELKAAILEKCDPSVKVNAYSGTLRMVKGQYKLTQPELDYTDGLVAFVVHGVLEIDKKVDPKSLFDKLERIDLYGVASGSPEQCGVLQTKLGINNGVIDNGEEDEKPEPENHGDDTYITEVAHLKL